MARPPEPTLSRTAGRGCLKAPLHCPVGRHTDVILRRGPAIVPVRAGDGSAVRI